MHYRVSCLRNSSFFKPLFIVGVGLLFFSQSSGGSEKETRVEDSTPSINGRNRECGKGEHVPLPEVVVPVSLLEDLDYKPAQAAISKIVQYLVYVSDDDYRPEIIKALQKEGINREGCEDFQSLLLKRALTAATDKSLETSLQPYLGALRKKNIGLQDIVKKFQEHVEAQGQKITQLHKENTELVSKLAEKEEENKRIRLELENQKTVSGSLRSRHKPLEIKEEDDLPLSRIGQKEKSTGWFCIF